MPAFRQIRRSEYKDAPKDIAQGSTGGDPEESSIDRDRNRVYLSGPAQFQDKGSHYGKQGPKGSKVISGNDKCIDKSNCPKGSIDIGKDSEKCNNRTEGKCQESGKCGKRTNNDRRSM